METHVLEIKTRIQIQRPAAAIFEAIVDPAKMSNYFISKGSGRMESEKVIMWKFPEFEIEFPIRTGELEDDRYIPFYWEVDGTELLVEITLTSRPDNSTLVTITEKGRNMDESGVKWLQGNTEGWANFLACLKAWVEYGINLRKGAFDFLADK